MRVPLSLLIEGKPLEVNESFPAENWQMDTEDVRFFDNIEIGCIFEKNADYIKVSVSFKANIDFSCSRCLEETRQDFARSFELGYYVKEIATPYLDIDADVREQVFLNWPYKFLCNEACKGICPYCGKNLNYEECVCKSN